MPCHIIHPCYRVSFRLRFHRADSSWNLDVPGTDRPSIFTGLLRTLQFGTASRLKLGLLWEPLWRQQSWHSGDSALNFEKDIVNVS